ncbi:MULTISPECIES: hypothetical protein [unclassified Aurantimonas]|uniref:hypothetical protein n=1 Tax=unclassified Aurantimonas TaxID=2638230 RepID=UPI002E19658B|nr:MULTISPECIES: hypothetical protein [unclassified Aurantimonas]MEC5293424.1 hypothetical protein [Aurantimonas sp. C2-3-R2]MEC5414511.1 hypothetical protein [Aurantimonas sp. C2-4-R8]
MSTAGPEENAQNPGAYGQRIGRASLLPGRAPLPDWWPSALMAAYGAGWCFTIPLGGNLFVAELIAAACLPFLGWNRTFARYPNLRLALVGYGLIVLGLIIADLANQTPLPDLVRGWANPVFAAIGLVFVVSVLRRDMHAFLYFLLATLLFKLVVGDASYELQVIAHPLLPTARIAESIGAWNAVICSGYRRTN